MYFVMLTYDVGPPHDQLDKTLPSAAITRFGGGGKGEEGLPIRKSIHV